MEHKDEIIFIEDIQFSFDDDEGSFSERQSRQDEENQQLDDEVKNINNFRLDTRDVIHSSQRTATPRPTHPFFKIPSNGTTTTPPHKNIIKIHERQPSPTTEEKVKGLIQNIHHYYSPLKKKKDVHWHQQAWLINTLNTFLSVSDILNCIKVCKQWNILLDSDESWEYRIERDIVISNITGFTPKKIYFMEKKRVSRRTHKWRLR
mmetsp:Transcript_12836/g.19336  ORF Transcript_12836/g.19336 Transcript_12836/m.19336 type:complete len:205 (-) Transcript_12836:571-1185(-)